MFASTFARIPAMSAPRRSIRRGTMRVGFMAFALAGLPGCVESGESGLPTPIYAETTISDAGSTLVVMGGITGTGSSYLAAGTDALDTVEARLAEVGLGSDAILRVRAALAPGDGAEFAEWNEAWEAHFSSGAAPARTTVGSSGLPDGALVVLDVVAAFPAGDVPSAGATGWTPTANPHIRLAGGGVNPTAIVSTGTGVFLSSGVLPSRGALDDPDSMEQQIGSVIGRLGNSLAEHGLTWADAFFVRVLPTPQPGLDEPDFGGWEPMRAMMTELAGGTAVPWSLWAAPGFSANGNFVEIEVWATWPEAFPAAADGVDLNAPLRMSGGPTGQIASAASVLPESDLVWVSGVIAPEGTDPEEEGMAALDLLQERLAAVGATMAGVAELRVYRVPGESGFNAAYSTHFNNPELNPHRPARTNYLVESLPMGRTVMVEAVVARGSGGS